MILRGVDQIVPADGAGYEHGSLTSVLREWASEAPFRELPFASILIADNLNDVEPLIAFNAHAARIRVPLPDAPALERALDAAASAAAEGVRRRRQPAAARRRARRRHGRGAGKPGEDPRPLRRRRSAPPISRASRRSWSSATPPGSSSSSSRRRTLDDYHGQEALKRWLRQDIALWQAGDLKALPMGYLLCGPVGTGKTFLVECLAGEAGVPVVKLKNFRDRWVGSSEGNLEKIFRLVRALGRCMVFIDEADQTLGRRESGSGDSGLVRPPVLDDRAGDVGHVEPRPRAVDPRLVAARPDRGRPEAPGPRRREGAAPADEHARARAPR